MKAALFIFIFSLFGYSHLYSQNPELKKKAESGDKVAQYEYACYLLDFFPSEEDGKEAVSWLIKSANQNYAPAQNYLGECLLEAEYVARNDTLAATLFQKAATQDNEAAQFNLGMCYDKGIGVPKSLRKSFEWYKYCASSGNVNAQRELAKCYYYGKYVYVNYEKTYFWLKKAIEQNDKEAKYYMGECYSNGYGMNKDLKAAIAWYEEAADDGFPKAQYKLAMYCLEGNGVYKDSARAAELLLHSAGGGWCSITNLATYNKKTAYDKAEEKLIELSKNRYSRFHGYFISILGCLYNAKEDYTNAEKYYKKGLQENCPLGLIELGIMYFFISANSPSQLIPLSDEIEGIDTDDYIGLESYKNADNDSVISYLNRKVWSDTDNVEYWLKKAIKSGYGDFRYGIMPYLLNDLLFFVYVDGIGGKRNLDKAINLAYKCLSTDSDSAFDEKVLNIALNDPNVSEKAFNVYLKLYSTSENKSDYSGILGKCYYKGLGTRKDYNQAFKYLSEAANVGNKESMRLLAACYRYGRGTDVNKNKENEWLKKAADGEYYYDEKARQILENNE